MTETNNGLFKPGQSGNPSGRPKSDIILRDIAREYTDSALNTLINIANSSKCSATARVQACNSILDRGWGKPAQYNFLDERVLNQNVPTSVSTYLIKERIEMMLADQWADILE